MTGYYIYVGYNSNHQDEEVWKVLEQTGLELCEQTEVLATQAFAFDQLALDKLREFAQPFAVREDLTIRFKGKYEGIGDEEEFRPHIAMLASGGGQDRLLKESVRRAFIRLLLNKMHLRQMEIDIVVG